MAKVRVRSPKVKEAPPKTYSQALKAGNLLFIAGQTAGQSGLGKKGEVKVKHKGDAYGQAVQAFRDIQALVEAGGGKMDDIMQLTIYLTDIRYADAVREARKGFFSGDYPTSTLLVVAGLALPDYLVEVEAIAVLPDG